MSESAFKKWYKKHSYYGESVVSSKHICWLAALRWALGREQNGKLLGYDEVIGVIDANKIKTEIKKIETEK